MSRCVGSEHLNTFQIASSKNIKSDFANYSLFKFILKALKKDLNFLQLFILRRLAIKNSITI